MNKEDEESKFKPEHDAAVREHVRRLKAFCDPAFIGDMELFARMYLKWQLEHGWRVIPPPPPWRALHDQPPVDSSQNEAVRDLREQWRARRGEG